MVNSLTSKGSFCTIKNFILEIKLPFAKAFCFVTNCMAPLDYGIGPPAEMKEGLPKHVNN